ncbi:MAG: PAS domain S-box protein [Desulfarculus sp.]|nr:PAS domain S-box protein [Desulfarculus sp.]
MKLKSKTSLLMALVVAIPLSMMGWLGLSTLEDSLRKAIYEEMETLAATAERTIHHFLEEGLSDARALALNLPARALEEKDAAQVERYLQAMQEVHPKYSNGMFLLDSQGVLWADYPPQPRARGQSFAYREYFQRTIQGQKGVVGRPYRSARTGQPVCTFTALVRGKDQRVLGMLGCSVDLLANEPLGLPRDLRVGRQGYYYVVDTTRLVILHPDQPRILQRDTPPGANKLLDAAIEGAPGVGETLNSRGVPMLVAFKQVRGTDWIVGAQKTREEALEPLRQARLRLLLGVLLGTLLAVGVGILAVRRITQPLARLRQATQEWGGPGFAEKLAGVAAGDEIGDLAHSFQEMGARLGQSMASLESVGRQWERTFDSVPDAVFLLDVQYRVTRLNRAAARLLNMEPSRAIGRPCYQLLHGQEAPPAHCPHLATLQTGQPARVEVEEPHLGRQMELSTTPLTGEDGRVAGSVYIVRDISERRRTQQALSESEKRYRTLVEQAMDLIAVVQDGKVVFANAAAENLLGWAAEEMVGQGPQVFYHPDDLPQVLDRYRRRMSGEVLPGIFMARMLTRQGQVKWVELASQLVEWGGRPAVQVVFRDITDRRKAEEALQQSEERYRSLVENVPYGLCITELPSGRFLFINRTVCEMFGYTFDEGLHKTLWDVTDPAEHQEMRRRVTLHLDGTGVATPSVYTGLRKDGGKFRYEATVALVSYQGRPALQGIIRDVTSQEMLERQLQQAQKMEAVGTLAGGVAHEFNNILMAIRGYTQLMAQTPDLPAKAALYLAKIENSTKRAADLTNTMLSFSRLDTGGRRAVWVNEVVEEVRALLGQTLPPHIELDLRLTPDLPPVRANQNHLEQVVLNLALNARDAMEEGGLLTIATAVAVLDLDFCGIHPWARPGPYVLIEVTDTGSGMPAAVLEHVFEPFFTTKEPGRGTGLGLALAYTMIKAHGGGLVVKSLAGQGSRFVIYLPATQGDLAAQEAAAAQEASPLAGQGQRLLVVDDEPAVREVAREALTQHGYRVHEAGHGQEALEMYAAARERGRPYGLVLLDLAMPVMDGQRCLELLLEMDPAARVLVATGHGGDESSLSALEGRAAGVLRKPFDLTTLLTQVAELLDGRA